MTSLTLIELEVERRRTLHTLTLDLWLIAAREATSSRQPTREELHGRRKLAGRSLPWTGQRTAEVQQSSTQVGNRLLLRLLPDTHMMKHTWKLAGTWCHGGQ